MPARTTVVYVDDDEDDRELLRDAFAAISDHALITLKNGVELFSYLPSSFKTVCLIVLDINLPGEDGIKIVERLQRTEDYLFIPVVMFTTGIHPPQIKALQEKKVEVIKKPSSYLEVKSIATTLLQHCLHSQNQKAS